MLYQAYQTQSDLMAPWRLLAQAGASAFWLGRTEGSPLRRLASALDVFSRLRLTHTRPDYGIHSVTIGDTPVGVTERKVLALPFGSAAALRQGPGRRPPGPAAGAAGRAAVGPLRDAAARDRPHAAAGPRRLHHRLAQRARRALREGPFALDDYITYMVRFLEAIGPGAHMMAVCQPCVAALAATAVMAEDDNPAQPRSLTLMAGPVDCRINPTSVNLLATSKPIDWFEKNLISHVPLPHAGFMRRVYPGFVQLSAFMSMNPERHKNAFKEMYHHLVDGDVEKANVIRVFYDEYLAVNDLPAEFYLETVEKVFQTYDLARGALRYRDRTVDTAAIRRTALMTVEGERDDICSVGQTVAAQDLCPNVRPYLKTHHIQTGVGHYGVFSGRKWNQQIYPRVREHIHASAG
jgi:poly(3-hydroxybutyrate) depolymerase